MKNVLLTVVSPLVGAYKLVSGTTKVISSAMERTNKRIEMAGERNAMVSRVRDQMARDNFDMEIVEHLVAFGLRESEAKQKADGLDEEVRERLKERQEQYGVLLGKDPFHVSKPADASST